jgi:hypothetical protein
MGWLWKELGNYIEGSICTQHKLTTNIPQMIGPLPRSQSALTFWPDAVTSVKALPV